MLHPQARLLQNWEHEQVQQYAASSALKPIKAKKKILFVSCNGLKKNRVGRSVKLFVFFMILLVKNVCFMHVLR